MKFDARMLVIPRQTLALVLGGAFLLVALTLVIFTGALADVGGVRNIAEPAMLISQRSAAENAIGRAFDNAADVLRRSHELKLAITPQQAAAIEAKTLTDLRTVRRNALQSIAQVYAMPPDESRRYVAEAEARLDVPRTGTDTGVLLAPWLLSIVVQMDEVAGQLSDSAARQLTNPFPSGAPTAAPTR